MFITPLVSSVRATNMFEKPGWAGTNTIFAGNNPSKFAAFIWSRTSPPRVCGPVYGDIDQFVMGGNPILSQWYSAFERWDPQACKFVSGNFTQADGAYKLTDILAVN